MPPRIDASHQVHSYFPAENSNPVAQPAVAPPRHSATPAAPTHPRRSGAQNLQRFFTSLNCFRSEPIDMDVTSEEGRANYRLAVKAWAARPASYIQEFQDRKKVAARIDEWLAANDPSITLNLSDLGVKLNSLPPLPSTLQSLDASSCFGFYGPRKYPKTWPAGLRELNLTNNKLRHLPENLPDGLQLLDVRQCSLKRLPAQLPRGLEQIYLAGNAIKSLPAELPAGLYVLDLRSNKLDAIATPLPDSLTELFLSHNPLGTLPTFPESLERLELDGLVLVTLPSLPPGLTELSVANNFLTSLPEDLPAGLQRLNASDNVLGNLPENLPNSLTRLGIARTSIEELPTNLPTGLDYLDISHTNISAIPDGLYQAAMHPGSSFRLVAVGVDFTGQVPVHAIQPDLGNLNFYGVGITSPSLSAAVEAWYDTPDPQRSEAWKEIYQQDQVENFGRTTRPFWKLLDSLKKSAEHPAEDGDTPATTQARSEMRAAFRQRVAHLLDAVLKNEDLRKTCFDLADGATESCHDNVSLGFDNMELEHLVARAMNGEFPPDEVFKLGIGKLKQTTLDEIAMKKGKSMANQTTGEGDESVEVALLYRSALGEKLDLPSKTKQMLFSDSAGVTQQELLAAEAHVNAVIADKERVISVMAKWKPWQATLERLHPGEFDRVALEEAKEKMFDEAIDLQVAYDALCKSAGEDSEETLQAKTDINLLMDKYNSLEDEMFREPRQRLTKAYVEKQ